MKARLLFLFLLLGMTKFATAQQAPLRLHPENPRYFEYRGRPLVIIGAGEHYGAVINLDFNYKTYLETLSRDSLNTTRLFTGAYVEKQGDFGIQKNTLAPAAGRLILPWRRGNQPGYALGGNKFDLSQWDEAYFTRLKDFMTEARRRDIIVEVTLFSSHYGGGWNYSPFNPANNVNATDNIPGTNVNTLDNGNILVHQERYVRKLVRELNGFDNLYFEIQNEPWADQSNLVLRRDEYSRDDDWRSTLQVVSAAANDWQRKVAQWIADEESRLPNRHLISQNIGNFFYPIAEADSTISIFNFHYASPRAVWENYHLNRAIGFNETGFAGRADSTYRRQAWRFLLAGGALFNHLDYSFSVGAENGQDTSYTAPGGGSPALRRQLGVLRHFMQALNLVNLRPDRGAVIAAPGAYTQALNDGRGQWVIYLEPMALRSYPLTLALPPGNYRARWMDVETGQVLETVSITDGQLPVPGGGQDLVVVVEGR